MSQVLADPAFTDLAPPGFRDEPGVRDHAPRWLQSWSIGTVFAALILLTLGAIVTTFRVGMADPVWPTQAWHLLLVSWQEPSAGFLIEHTHRLVGNVVGCCVIVLAIGLWCYEPRVWLRRLALLLTVSMIVALALGFGFHGTNMWIAAVGTIFGSLIVLMILAVRLRDAAVWLRVFGSIALGCVMLQGVLGGFRVQLDALFGPGLAVIHGCFAQIVFAMLAAFTVLTGQRNRQEVQTPKAVRRGSAHIVGILVIQLVLGAMLRHTMTPLWQRLHLLTAFVAVAGVVWLTVRVLSDRDRLPALVRPILVLAVLTGLQILFGAEAWMGRFSAGGLLPELRKVTIGQAVVRTGHVVIGSCVLAAAVVTTLLSYQRAALVTGRAAA
jgi:heme A synthase